jgi:hypothetical protein
MTASDLLGALDPRCRDEARRADLLAHPFLNGIDYVEYEHRPAEEHPHVLVVRMLRPMPADAYELPAQPALAVVAGGTRVRGIRAHAIRRADDTVLEVDVSDQGDFSNYWLALGWRRAADGHWEHVVPEIDRPFSVAPINFRPGCLIDFDCAPEEVCPPGQLPEPVLDYLAKDYASFRRLLLDLVAQRNPRWIERNPADLGITLLELMAYVGDYLSYFQDAVANEAYLETARQRVSVKRHARLVDYRMHDGRNAWTAVHFVVSAAGTLPMGTALLTRVVLPLSRQPAPPGPVIPDEHLGPEALRTDPALVRTRVFETSFALAADPANNELRIHTWGNRECCLPRGATSAYLYTLSPPGAGGVQAASLPPLVAGDYLLFEEVLSPTSGDPADADPEHRLVVRIERVEAMEDPAYRATLVDGVLQRLPDEVDVPRLPLLRVSWRERDALPFPLCLAARTVDGDYLANVSVARGNIVLADHGYTMEEEHELPEPVSGDVKFRLTLRERHLTMQCPPSRMELEAGSSLAQTERHTLDCGADGAAPAISLRVQFPAGPELWLAVPDLLDSPPGDNAFVAETDHEGRATLRFGDDEYGRAPTGATGFTASYRIGNGSAGNIGAEALAHVAQPAAAVGWPAVEALRNPLPAGGGTDPETIEEVRQYAPAAFHAVQFRAVTEADYAAAARRAPGVADAVAQFRWTGSWHTVFLGIDPRSERDLITEAGGRTRLSPSFERSVRTFVTRYRLAGYDLELRTAVYVPLEVEVEICVCRDHFRADVAEAVRRALSGRGGARGEPGFFHSANFSFGQPVYLSRLYAAIERVPGVDSVVVTRFQRYDREPAGELESGVLPIGPWEIARLDNDPSAKENGVLHIIALGGK